jgi:dephospho-CoA kinase
MIVLGLTGSIGMGKSTTAALFAERGVPIYEADATVHRLYRGAAVPLVEAAFPGTTRDGAVDRQALSAAVLGRPEAVARLEAIVHPLVRAEEAAFLERCRKAGAPLALLDVPLLFETGGADRVDAVAVVTAPADVQRARVMARPGMTAAKLDAILARQMPDAEKRRRAHFVVDTSRGLESARVQVDGILRATAMMMGMVGRRGLAPG